MLRRAVMENALKFRTRGLLLRTLKRGRLAKLAEEYAQRFGLKRESILSCCGRIISKHSRPATRSRAYVVTSSLVSYLFDVTWEKLRDRPLHSLDPLEDYYVALMIEEWGDGYRGDEEGEG